MPLEHKTYLPDIYLKIVKDTQEYILTKFKANKYPGDGDSFKYTARITGGLTSSYTWSALLENGFVIDEGNCVDVPSIEDGFIELSFTIWYLDKLLQLIADSK